ncbi:MAG: hypothetical protein K9K88_15515 [Desulfobacterales bacterium]|nr:hypothetical protein [Desulfobacterales bacterium]
MEPYTVFPDKPIVDAGPVSRTFLDLGIGSFHEACAWVRDLPYGYNSDRDDLMILFKEKMGSCTTKHAVIATLGAELGLAVEKHIGIYPMTEALITGTQNILDRYRLPYVPMVHCFLVFRGHRVDLSEDNRNGKNGPIDVFLHTEAVAATISAKDEYLLYRKALKDHLLGGKELQGVDMKTVLKAREEGLSLLRKNVQP